MSWGEVFVETVPDHINDDKVKTTDGMSDIGPAVAEAIGMLDHARRNEARASTVFGIPGIPVAQGQYELYVIIQYLLHRKCLDRLLK